MKEIKLIKIFIDSPNFKFEESQMKELLANSWELHSIISEGGGHRILFVFTR